MKKRYIGRSSASLANGLVAFPGDVVELSEKEWRENAHLDEVFTYPIADEEPAAEDADEAPAEAATAPAPAKRSKKNDKE